MFTLIGIENKHTVEFVFYNTVVENYCRYTKIGILFKTIDKRTKNICHQNHFVINQKHKLLN